MLPVPTRPASDTAIAWKLEIPSSDFPPLKIRRIISAMYRTWNNRMRIEKYNPVHTRDRKSTRLNSSHVSISYAVFCLKKKKILQYAFDLKVLIQLIT